MQRKHRRFPNISTYIAMSYFIGLIQSPEIQGFLKGREIDVKGGRHEWKVEDTLQNEWKERPENQI